MKRYWLLIIAVLSIGVAISLSVTIASAQGQVSSIHVQSGDHLLITMESDAIVTSDCLLDIIAIQDSTRHSYQLTCRPLGTRPILEGNEVINMKWVDPSEIENSISEAALAEKGIAIPDKYAGLTPRQRQLVEEEGYEVYRFWGNVLPVVAKGRLVSFGGGVALSMEEKR